MRDLGHLTDKMPVPLLILRTYSAKSARFCFFALRLVGPFSIILGCLRFLAYLLLCLFFLNALLALDPEAAAQFCRELEGWLEPTNGADPQVGFSAVSNRLTLPRASLKVA
jgi:hypothetical protein